MQRTAVNVWVTSYFSSPSQLQDYRRPEAFCNRGSWAGKLPELHARPLCSGFLRPSSSCRASPFCHIWHFHLASLLEQTEATRVQLRGVEMPGPDSLLHSAQCLHTCFSHPQNYRHLRTAPRSAFLTQTVRSAKAWGCNSRQRCRVGKALYAVPGGCLRLCKPFTGHFRV